MAVAFVLLELVVVPVGVLLLALSIVPGDRGPVTPGEPPANAKTVHLPATSEPGTVLLAVPRRRSGPRSPAVR